VQALEDEALARDREHGFGLLLTAGIIHRGWLLAQGGAGEEGLAQMQAGLAKHREIGVVVLVPSSLALMADVHRKLGRLAEGLAAATEALTVAKRSGRHYWEAEAHRLVGVLTLEAGASPEAAESHFREAIAIARRQRAMSLELRASVGLARLWADHGKAGAAYALLSGVYGWFTEGFDTADLKEAAALLAGLRQEAEQSPERDGDEEPA
jgi:predicted ATPase